MADPVDFTSSSTGTTSLDAVHPTLIAADTANMQAGASDSLLENVGNFAGAAVVSGVSSIYNTAAALIGAEKVDVQEWLNTNDQHMGAYYEANKGLVDTAGFVATSIIPGGLAVKGVNLAKAGTFAGPFGRALGYASSKQQFYLNQGLKELAVEGGSVYSIINKNALATLAWGTADQMLTVAAFETAVAATMKQSPLLEKDDWADAAKHIALTSLAFGGAIGLIEGIAVNSIFKGATKTIDAALREHDTLRIPVGDIPTGDKAYGIVQSILNLPIVGRNVEFTYQLAGKEGKLTLPTTEALEKASAGAEKHGWEQFRLTLNTLAKGDAEAAQPMADFVIDLVAKGKAAGNTKDEILDRVADHMLNVGAITRIGADAAVEKNVFYLAKEIPVEKLPSIKSFDDLLASVANRAPTGADVSKQPFQMIGSPNDIKMGIAGLKTESPAGATLLPRYASVEDGFAEGADAVVLANGTVRINPNSNIFKKVPDPILTPRSYFNVRTGSFTDIAFPAVADIASSTKPLRLTAPDHLVSGGKNWNFKAFDTFALDEVDSLGASARYVYAKNLAVVPSRVAVSDFPMLERIFQDGSKKWKDTLIVDGEGESALTYKVSDIADFGEWMKQKKLGELQKFFAENPKGADLSDLAIRLNVEEGWIEKAVVSNFQPTGEVANGFTVPLDLAGRVRSVEVRWDFAKAKEVAKGTLSTPTGRNLEIPKENVMVQTLPDGANNVVFGQLGFEYRKKLATEGLIKAFTSVMGSEKARRFIDLDPEVATKIADSLGSGAGLIKFSNADYGDPLRLWSQYTGQQVNILGKEAANTALSGLQPLMLAIKDDANAAAELGVLTTALRRSSEKFMIDPENKFLLVNTEVMKKQKDGSWLRLEGKAKELTDAGRRVEFKIESDKVADFMAQSTATNAGRIERMKVLMTARGFGYNYDPLVVYAPAVDTSRYPYFAFVRKNQEMMGGSSEVSMITARSEAELRALTNKVPDGYEVLFDKNTKAFHKAKGDYDYDLTLKEPTINSTLMKRGVLGDFFPETRAENVLDDFISWHQRQEVSVVRRAVETRYAQTFEEIRSIGAQFEEVGSSKFGGILKKFKSQLQNPFEDYLKTALDISKRSEYTLLHEANEFAEALGKSAYAKFGANMEKAMKGTVSWEEANRISERYGIAGPYTGTGEGSAYWKANTPEDKNIVREFVGKANMLLVNLTLRLDWANSLVNVISTPILLGTEMASIRSLVEKDSVLAGKLAELRSIAVPDTEGVRVPSTLSLLGKSIQNFWSPEKAALLQRYKDVGAIQETLSQYHEMVEQLTYKPYMKVSELVEKGNKAVEIGAKYAGNNFAEQFTRFVSADVMRQLTDPIVAAGKLSLAEQNAYISVFVNRVQGNYLASQRPILFQGVLGSAVSLFQTYQFNLLQQLFRHIENRDTRAIATLGGLQSGIYGMNGIPFFEAVNTHLVGNSSLNPEHKDVYSTLPQIAGKEMGDWMMYGTASAFPLWGSKAPSLYTRGDINPRHISIIPISPLDVPAVDGSIRFVKNLVDTGKKIAQGADISGSLLEGLEHNSLSRPLAGVAQVVSGQSTTSKGSLISASNDFSAIATASRILGAKPLDESLALNSLFRINAYQAADQARIQDLGEVVKTKLRDGRLPSLDELHSFQTEYAKAGGRIENYSKTLQRWSRDANVSVVNQLAQNHRTSYSQRMMEIMGGTTLPDFRQKQATQVSVPAADGSSGDTEVVQ